LPPGFDLGADLLLQGDPPSFVYREEPEVKIGVIGGGVA
jgi:hypothetical protein